MNTAHKYLENYSWTSEVEKTFLDSLVPELAADLIQHDHGHTLNTIAGRLRVSNNNVAIIVGGRQLESELVQSAMLTALGDSQPYKSSLLVVPAENMAYDQSKNFPYVLPIAAKYDAWDASVKWYICDVETIRNEPVFDSMMARLDYAKDYLKYGGEKPAGPPPPPPISRQLGYIATNST